MRRTIHNAIILISTTRHVAAEDISGHWRVDKEYHKSFHDLVSRLESLDNYLPKCVCVFLLPGHAFIAMIMREVAGELTVGNFLTEFSPAISHSVNVKGG